jgi:hypothetical protein
MYAPASTPTWKGNEMTVEVAKPTDVMNQEALGHQVLLATMPRSGTWYSNLFFSFYLQLLSGREDLTVPASLLNLSYENSQGLVTRMVICHTACPGFERCQGPWRSAWDKLQFHGGTDIGHHQYSDLFEQSLNPRVNRDARIIYVYRNPLDQVVSAFQHLQGHNLSAQLLCYRNREGVECRVADARKFCFIMGLGSFIKQYLTFKVMKQSYPEAILMIPYEDLSRDSTLSFLKMLEFMGQDVSDMRHQKIIGTALHLSSKDSVKRIEKRSGHSLSNDQEKPGASHIKDGGVGRWKTVFGSHDLSVIESRLKDFSLSLDEFILE